MPALESSSTSLKTRLCVMMFLQYFVQGSFLPIITLYAKTRLGFTPDQLGVLTAALAIGPLGAAFVVGQLVDRHFASQRLLGVVHLVAAGVMLALSYCSGYWTVIVLGAIYSLLYTPTMMVTNSLAFHHLRDRDREFPLVRLWGTIGFIIPAWLIEPIFLAGYKGDELIDARVIYLLFGAGSGLVMALYSFMLPHTPPTEGRSKFAPGAVVKLLGQRHFLVLVVVSLGISIVHKYHFMWNSPFVNSLLLSGNVEGAWEGRISSIGQIAEIAVMAGLGLLILSVGFKATMLAGIAAYLLRCLVFAGAAAIEGAYTLAMTLTCVGQALHGMCFGCFLAAAFMYIDRRTPADLRGSAQNFYGTFVVGFGMFVGGFFGGRVGGVFTTPAGAETVRERLGIASTAGLRAFVQDGNKMVGDWPGIWLAGAALAAICLVAFALSFPRGGGAPEPGESEEVVRLPK